MTRDYVHEHFAKHPAKHPAKSEKRGCRVVPRIVCADGFSLSVQASYGHYCSPRDATGPYRLVEVGYPENADGRSVRPRSLGRTDDGDVWGYVPVDTVNRLIRRHGGVKED